MKNIQRNTAYVFYLTITRVFSQNTMFNIPLLDSAFVVQKCDYGL